MLKESGPFVVSIRTDLNTLYYLDMTYCVSLKVTPGKLICSFTDGEKFEFTEDMDKQKIIKAFKQSKQFPEYKEDL